MRRIAAAKVVAVGCCGCYVQVLTPPTPLFFCADEIKDDFDALGPDAALQAVGNGTGELSSGFF